MGSHNRYRDDHVKWSPWQLEWRTNMRPKLLGHPLDCNCLGRLAGLPPHGPPSLTRSAAEVAPTGATATRAGSSGVWRWLAAAGTTKEAALLQFNSVRITVSTICRVSFVCAQARIEAE